MNIHALHDIYKNHLFLENTHIIDIAAATYVTRTLPGDRLCLFPYGASGLGKTELVRPFMDLPDVVFLDTVTSKAFTAGNLKARLEDKETMILIPDLAGMSAEDEDEKRKICSTFRTLFDGYIKRDTARGDADANAKNVKANMLAFSTPAIKRDLEFSALMGTREIMYELPTMSNNPKLYDKQIDDSGRTEIKRGAKAFFENLEVPWVEPNVETKKILREMAERIATWRVVGLADTNGYLLEKVYAEVPKRLYVQLTKLWKGLTRIGLLPIEVETILKNIEERTGNKLREDIHRWLNTDYSSGTPVLAPSPMTIKELSVKLNSSPIEVRKQLMVLRSMNKVELLSDNYDISSIWEGKPWEYMGES